MNWIHLKEEDQIDEIITESHSNPVMIFKHSTSCNISGMAFDRINRSWDEGEMENVSAYYLDLLSFRNISNAVAEKFSISHQSPQVLIIKDGKCVYDTSHMGINYGIIRNQTDMLKAS